MDSFDERLRKLRAEKRLKQLDVAKAVGISIGAYQRYEYGELKPKQGNEKAIADFFGVSVEYLRGETESRNNVYYETYEPKDVHVSENDGFEIHAHRDPTVSGMDLDQALGLVTQLEKLSKLHDDGKLTDEEYSILKSKIIRG